MFLQKFSWLQLQDYCRYFRSYLGTYVRLWSSSSFYCFRWQDIITIISEIELNLTWRKRWRRDGSIITYSVILSTTRISITIQIISFLKYVRLTCCSWWTRLIIFKSITLLVRISIEIIWIVISMICSIVNPSSERDVIKSHPSKCNNLLRLRIQYFQEVLNHIRPLLHQINEVLFLTGSPSDLSYQYRDILSYSSSLYARLSFQRLQHVIETVSGYLVSSDYN